MRSQRLFLALPVPPTVQALLGELMDPLPSMRWTPVEQLHITLRFLGDVDVTTTEPLIERLQQVQVQSFILPVEGVGAFPPKGDPRVLWVGVGGGHPRLHQLRQRVDDTVLTFGLPIDVRNFHPHVTIARCAEGAARAVRQWLRDHEQFAGPSFAIDAFHLYASELRPSGAVHTLLARFPLTTPSSHAPSPT